MIRNKTKRSSRSVIARTRSRPVRLAAPSSRPRSGRQVYRSPPPATAVAKTTVQPSKLAGVSPRRWQWRGLGFQFGMFICALCALALLGGGGGYLVARLLVVDRISCTVNQVAACPVVVTESVKNFVGRSLFLTNFRQELWAFRRQDFSFTDVSYQKQLSGQLNVDFAFAPPLYLLVAPGDKQFAFDEFGHYTLTADKYHLPQIMVEAPEILLALTQYQLDPVVHQKIYDLLYLSREQWSEWSAITLVSLRQLEIVTAQARYLLDPFSLDENLQKLVYLETSDFWVDHDSKLVIDLRLNVPVVKSV